MGRTRGDRQRRRRRDGGKSSYTTPLLPCHSYTTSFLLGVGYYLSSSVNPLLYSVMSKRFRRGFRDMFSNRGGSGPSHVGTSGDHGGDIGDKGGSVLHRHSTRRGRGGGVGNGGGGGSRLIGQYQLHEWQRTTENAGNGIASVDASHLRERDRGKKS